MHFYLSSFPSDAKFFLNQVYCLSFSFPFFLLCSIMCQLCLFTYFTFFFVTLFLFFFLFVFNLIEGISLMVNKTITKGAVLNYERKLFFPHTYIIFYELCVFIISYTCVIQKVLYRYRYLFSWRTVCSKKWCQTKKKNYNNKVR